MITARQQRWNAVLLYVGCVAAALVASAVIVSVSEGSAASGVYRLGRGFTTERWRVGRHAQRAAPLLLVALGATLASRAGLVNIGQEGQLLIGAMCAAYFGNHLGGGGAGILIIALAGGFVGGAIWSGIAAALRFKAGVPEVLSTLLLVSCSFSLGYALSSDRFLRDADPAARQQLNSGTKLPANTRLPNIDIFGNRFHIGVLLALIVRGRRLVLHRLHGVGLSPSYARVEPPHRPACRRACGTCRCGRSRSARVAWPGWVVACC